MQEAIDLLLNIDDAKADMKYWCKYEWLTVGQLTLLSFGLNPNVINFECIRKRQCGSFLSEYKDRHNLIRQAPIA